jgi:glycosyltransferase involved in cell wall biosynthesis
VTGDKYILQYGSLAGWPYQVAQGLRSAGYNSINVIQENSDVHDLDRRLPHDRAVCRKEASKARKFVDRARFLMQAGSEASLIHYHGGVILRGQWHHLLEGPLLKRRGIPMLMSFGGGDARIVSQARAMNPYFYREPDEARDNQIRAYLQSISRYIRYAATDCEMMTYAEPYFEKCFVFRQPVDTGKIAYVAPDGSRKPVVLHIPTEPQVKGTPFIVAAAERLKNEGYDFEFRLKRQLTQAQMHTEIAQCDIYVDELRCGSHGVTAVETMAAGKPTMTYLRPDLLARYPADIPLVNANPDTVYDKLKELLSDAALRADISVRSRKYAEKYHDVRVVVQDLIGIYKEIGLR